MGLKQKDKFIICNVKKLIMVEKTEGQLSKNDAEKINLETMRINFKDGDTNNRNLETKTNYMIAINITIYSLFFYFLFFTSFILISNIGLIIVMFLTMFITLDSIFIFKNLIPTGFRKIPLCNEKESMEIYLNRFDYDNYINSLKTEEKANNLKAILISLFLKMFLIFIIITLLK